MRMLKYVLCFTLTASSHIHVQHCDVKLWQTAVRVNSGGCKRKCLPDDTKVVTWYIDVQRPVRRLQMWEQMHRHM